MVGWLPNCTSKMQLADVSLFGDFKCKLEAMESRWITENPGKQLDRTIKRYWPAKRWSRSSRGTAYSKELKKQEFTH